MKPYTSELYGFGGSTVFPKGKIALRILLGDGPVKKDALVEFIVVEGLKWYNVILGKPSMVALDMAISPKHLTAKFHTDEGEVVLLGRQEESRKCNIDGMKDNITLMVLDSNQLKDPSDTPTRIKPVDEIVEIKPWNDQSKVLRIGGGLTPTLQTQLS